MPTDNPKISLYVPQKIYDRFKEFQEKQDLSMSQAGIVILAEYFGIEETIKEITEGTTIGGITLAEFEQLKERIEILEDQVSLNRKILDEERKIPTENPTKQQVEQNESTSSSPTETKKNHNDIGEVDQVDFNKTTSSSQENERTNSKLQFNLPSKLLDLKPIPATHLSQKRFGLGKNTLASYKRKHTLEELAAWTKEKDPDEVTWVYDSNSRGYIPKEDTSDEQLDKISKWIAENI